MKYLLHTRAGEVRMYVRLDEDGVELRDGQLFWSERGRQKSAHLKDLSRVNLKVNFGGRARVVGIMVLWFRDGTTLNIFSADAVGRFDRQRSATYRSFVQDLHDAIPQDCRSRIAFVAGGANNNAARVAGALTLAAAVAAAVAVLWNIEAITTEIVIILGLAGFFLIWPLSRLMSANSGESYRPHRIPENLLP
ncbi:hypothetical protein HPDFL43_04680 [Hoeflea phototrophica DFL-43]|jgi:hypothetical protein|uniref:Uncharacterized protein n=1 Tax=Hoeflea phototrophica (strain DSM 17068 / NCIMB 14078 / DFL-43) TaxID=411684 RepID=A9D3Q4_HOEPD|nr:hypothetical protein [Hoeflea phototrophica]EDQ33719.1 hypothetical protein HPDFL43_04680 [Hoeflea phototrophica DFL-43]